MEKSGMKDSAFSRVDQIGVVVRDLDRAIEYYESLGIGPFKSVSVTVKERLVRGEPNDTWKFKICTADMGPVQFELVQPVSGETIHKEFLESAGEGINHLAFFVSDFEKEYARLVEQGLKVIYCVRFEPSGGAAYFDTGEVGGVLFEIIQLPPKG